jgi:HAMP domain-containing protein
MIEQAVADVLRTAQSWTNWDGTPIPIDDRVYTPHKAIRRTADHLIDHLAEVEARLAGVATIPDHWHASAITTAADLAPFTAADLAEATSRLTRLAQIWAVRLDALSEERLDRVEPDTWTIRAIAEHLSSTYYANAVGDLDPAS